MKAIVVDKEYGSVKADELEIVRAAYEQAGIEFKAMQLNTEDEIIDACQDTDVILATGNPPMTKKVMTALPKLRYIQRFGAGVNSIDLQAASELGKIVLNLPGFCAKELADLATAMIMALTRNVAYYDREIRKGNWPKCQYLIPGDVRTMTLGFYGFGLAARYLHDIFHNGFGTKTIACDPYISEEIKKRYPDVEFVTFGELLKASDIISIHVILTPETTHVFNKAAFIKMKNNAMIINTSRGPVIDQEDLAWALKNDEIRYAGLDTLEKEPISLNDSLLGMDNVILNPHSGSYGVGAKKTQIQMVCDLVPNAVLKHELPARPIANRDVAEKIKDLKII